VDPFYTGIGLFYVNLLILGINDSWSRAKWDSVKWYQRFRFGSYSVWWLQLKLIDSAVFSIFLSEDGVWPLAFLWLAVAIGLVHLANLFLFEPRRAIQKIGTDCLPTS